MKSSYERAMRINVICPVVDRQIKFRANAVSSIGDRLVSCRLICGHSTKFRLQIKEPRHRAKRMRCKQCEDALKSWLSRVKKEDGGAS